MTIVFAPIQSVRDCRLREHFLLALYEDFQDDLIVMLDGVSFFWISAVTDLAARVDLALVRLPAYSLELNLVEEYWRQLNAVLGTRFVDSPGQFYSKYERLLLTSRIPITVRVIIPVAGEQ